MRFKVYVRAKTKFVSPLKLICPVQSLAQKFSSSIFPNFMVVYPHPASIEEGRFAVVTSVGGGERWPVGAQRAYRERTNAIGRTMKSYGPGAPMLASSSQQMLAHLRGRRWLQARTPGRLRINRKPIARGGPGVFGQTCGTCRLHFF
ncbi:hypothetical protein [Bradyrhizobium sp. SZCCHNRI3043]|uniref:hypothetical protein n=1 Tax=Bradyrhizobium sp. SZCCHNRI3043 TaxID=3057292 RepID=UPI0028E58992|nr:hypothetical protein [Bradyrhizobium sp. SZCCHNRI3043]